MKTSSASVERRATGVAYRSVSRPSCRDTSGGADSARPSHKRATQHNMLTGELRSQVDAIWNAFWSGGIANPIEVIDLAPGIRIP